MGVSSRRRQCDFRQGGTVAVLPCSSLLLLFLFGTLSLSSEIAAASRPLRITHAVADQLAAADDTSSNPSGKLQEFEIGAKDEYAQDITRWRYFVRRHLTQYTTSRRRLPPPPPIVHYVILPCAAPPPPNDPGDYSIDVSNDGKVDKTSTLELLCVPLF